MASPKDTALTQARSRRLCRRLPGQHPCAHCRAPWPRGAADKTAAGGPQCEHAVSVSCPGAARADAQWEQMSYMHDGACLSSLKMHDVTSFVSMNCSSVCLPGGSTTRHRCPQHQWRYHPRACSDSRSACIQVSSCRPESIRLLTCSHRQNALYTSQPKCEVQPSYCCSAPYLLLSHHQSMLYCTGGTGTPTQSVLTSGQS